jgi:DNA polymerase-4/DNA polymerase V
VLAKIGSKWNKPAGLTAIPLSGVRPFLEKTPVGSVWGIGPNTAAYLAKYGISSAFDFARKDEAWVRSHLTKPGVEVWQELNGTQSSGVDAVGRESYQSISKTKTFTPPSRDRAFVLSQLSKNIENACLKARRWGLATPEIFFFLKTQDFKYHGFEIKLSHPTCVPQDILKLVTEYFPRVYRQGGLYRATGVTLLKLCDAQAIQLDLFGSVMQSQGLKHVFDSVDEISERYGKHSIFLGSSMDAMKYRPREGERGGPSTVIAPRFVGETARRRVGTAFLGEVS